MIACRKGGIILLLFFTQSGKVEKKKGIRNLNIYPRYTGITSSLRILISELVNCFIILCLLPAMQ